VSAMAIAVGILFILIGLGIRDVRMQTAEAPATQPVGASRS
jgi:hypothetical protein